MSAARILCAWELGANLGHLGQLRPVMRALALDFGHKVLRARAPRLRVRRPDVGGRIPLDDALDAVDQAPAVAAWGRILDASRPDAVLLNAAPFLSMAANARGLPRFVVGDSYWLPSVSKYRDALWGDRAFLATFAALDHEGPREGVAYCGALYMDEEGAVPAWSGRGARVGVYLRAGWAPLCTLAAVLKEKSCDAVFFVPDASDALLERLRSLGVRAQRRPLRFSTSGGDYDLLVCHAGHGTVAASLVAGVPLLLAPQYVEQDLTARRILQLGAGRRVAPDALAGVLRGAVEDLLDGVECRAGATAFRAGCVGYRPAVVAGVIAGVIDRALGVGRGGAMGCAEMVEVG